MNTLIQDSMASITSFSFMILFMLITTYGLMYMVGGPKLANKFGRWCLNTLRALLAWAAHLLLDLLIYLTPIVGRGARHAIESSARGVRALIRRLRRP